MIYTLKRIKPLDLRPEKMLNIFLFSSHVEMLTKLLARQSYSFVNNLRFGTAQI